MGPMAHVREFTIASVMRFACTLPTMADARVIDSVSGNPGIRSNPGCVFKTINACAPYRWAFLALSMKLQTPRWATTMDPFIFVFVRFPQPCSLGLGSTNGSSWQGNEALKADE